MTQIASGQAVEGVMDLAVYHASFGWLIVDWKTGMNDSAANLEQSYGDQVRFYRNSVAAFTGEKAMGVLYGTASGEEVLVAA
jgi:ATP-dependent exoDNAse (exonuclease V) beta subunit